MRINTILLLAGVLLLSVSFWKRNDLPGNVAFDPAVAEEPKQAPTSRKPFPVEFKGVEYRVEPEFEYDLYGMIVSYRHHGEASRMHRLAHDHLNMADICVVWGKTAESDYLDELDFWNGIFTCNVHTSSSEAWAHFDRTQLSNNHLISSDASIRERVSDIDVGDQVHVRGVLAAYSSDGGGRRGTSTTRDDTGDGACETIFIDEFEIIEPARSYWSMATYLSLLVIAITTTRHFRRPYRPYS